MILYQLNTYLLFNYIDNPAKSIGPIGRKLADIPIRINIHLLPFWLFPQIQDDFVWCLTWWPQVLEVVWSVG